MSYVQVYERECRTSVERVSIAICMCIDRVRVATWKSLAKTKCLLSAEDIDQPCCMLYTTETSRHGFGIRLQAVSGLENKATHTSGKPCPPESETGPTTGPKYLVGGACLSVDVIKRMYIAMYAFRIRMTGYLNTEYLNKETRTLRFRSYTGPTSVLPHLINKYSDCISIVKIQISRGGILTTTLTYLT